MLTNIDPAVKLSETYQGKKTTDNEEYVKLVAENNVLNTISQIRKKSPILKEMEDNGQIKIVGVFYILRTGQLKILN
jgi:carbonic anhydrase